MSETRQEAYLTYLAGDTDVTLPEPVTQLEKYWHDIAERVSGAVDAPTGTIELVENGEYSVAEYATAKVNVPEGNYERLTNAQIDTSGQIAYVDFSGSSSLSSFFVVTGESSNQGVVEVGDVLKIGLNKDLFGDADDAQVVSGVTYTSKNGLKRKGGHVCSGGSGELNIHFGDTEPTDNKMLWVKADATDNITISPEMSEGENYISGVATLPAVAAGVGVAQVDGKIYMFGATSNYTEILMYDPSSGEVVTLDTVLNTSANRYYPAVVGKKIYLNSYQSNMDIFDTETKTVTSVSSSAKSKVGAAVGSKIYYFGNDSTTVNVYDTETNTWSNSSKSLPEKRNSDVGVAVVDKKIYLFGGTYTASNYSTVYTNAVCVYDTNDLTVTTYNTLPDKMWNITASPIGTDIYLFGGYTYTDTEDHNTIYKYDTIANELQLLDTTLPNASNKIGAATLGSDVYLVGGCHGSTVSIDRIDKFSLRAMLEPGSIHVLTSGDKPPLWEVMSKPVIRTYVEDVLIGASGGGTEEVESYLYANGDWERV